MPFKAVINLCINTLDCLEYPLSSKVSFIIVAAFDGLTRTGTGSGRYGSSGKSVTLGDDIDFNGRVPPGIQNLSGNDFLKNKAHINLRH
uniref:Uncharacterized protein n=1 Tax=Escherichia coli TaxID=562 RepID=B7JCB6_ECOLX|nr:hypothetical protein pO103_19 [Escherichia coli]